MQLKELEGKIKSIDPKHKFLKIALEKKYQELLSKNQIDIKPENKPVNNSESIQKETNSVLPYINSNGVLIINSLGPKKYHYWDKKSKGQSLLETLLEFNADDEVIKRYVEGWNHEKRNLFSKN